MKLTNAILDKVTTMKRDKQAYKHLAFNIYNNAAICVKCYSTEQIVVHHIDENPCNNKENNLQILCRCCHMSIHFKGKNNTKEQNKKISQNHKRYWKGKQSATRDKGIKVDGLGKTSWCEKYGKSQKVFYRLAKQKGT